MAKDIVISGPDFAKLIKRTPDEYKFLYPNIDKPNVNPEHPGLDPITYCPCKDVNISHCEGHRMLTVMDAFEREELEYFPADTQPVFEGQYVSGEVWRDEKYSMLWLYGGKTEDGQDVALDLGGKTVLEGCFTAGIVNEVNSGGMWFRTRLFPTN